MNQYIPFHHQIVHGIHQGTTQPAWYTDFLATWRSMIISLIAEAQEVEEPETLFTCQQRDCYCTNKRRSLVMQISSVYLKSISHMQTSYSFHVNN